MGDPGYLRVFYGYLSLSLFHGIGDHREHRALLEDALQSISRLSPDDKEVGALESDLLRLKSTYLQLEGKLAERRQLVGLLSRHGEATGAESHEPIDASLDLAETELALGESGEGPSPDGANPESLRDPLSRCALDRLEPRGLLIRVAQERGELERAQELIEAWTPPTRLGELSQEIAHAENAALRGDLDRTEPCAISGGIGAARPVPRRRIPSSSM